MSIETETPEQAEETEAPEAAAEGAEAPAAEEGEYKIGDQSFKSADEAFAYANSLVHKNAITEAQANAYRQAVTDSAIAQAGAQKVTPQAEPEEDDFEQKFYENPKKFLQEFKAKIKEEAKQEVLGTVSQQSEDEKLWGEFFNQNPDLAAFREDCEHTLAKYQRDVVAVNQTRGQKAAMEFLAQKTRAKFQQYVEMSKPKKELSRTSSGPSFGSANNVTRSAPKEQDLDFAQQIRSLRGKQA